MVLIDKLQTARSIDYTRQSFKTRLPRSLVGIWPHQLAQSTPRQGRITSLRGFWFWSDSRSPTWLVMCWIWTWLLTAALTVEFLEVVLSLPVTMQCPCSHCSFTKSDGYRCQTPCSLSVYFANYSLDSCNNAFASATYGHWTAWNFDGTKPYLESFAPHFGHSLKPESIKTACSAKKALCTLESREICSSWRTQI